MNDNRGASCNWDTLLENFAADLTCAVYPIALRHGMTGTWLKVELGLWMALARTIKKWEPEWAAAGPSDKFKAWREGLLLDLTVSAFSLAVKHGIRGSLLEVELGMYRALRLVMRRRYGAR